MKDCALLLRFFMQFVQFQFVYLVYEAVECFEGQICMCVKKEYKGSLFCLQKGKKCKGSHFTFFVFLSSFLFFLLQRMCVYRCPRRASMSAQENKWGTGKRKIGKKRVKNDWVQKKITSITTTEATRVSVKQVFAVTKIIIQQQQQSGFVQWIIENKTRVMGATKNKE